MKKNSLTLFALVVLLVLESCEQTIVCKAYDDVNFAGWFSYSEGQRLVFKSKAGNTDTTLIGSIYRSPRTEHTETIGGKQRECEEKIEIAATPEPDKLEIIHSKGYMTPTYFHLRFRTLKISAGSITDNGIDGNGRSKLWIPVLHYNADFGGKNYGVMEEIQITDTAAVKSSKTDRLYIGKGYGIVGYRTYPDQEYWWIQ